ncbi:MAG: exodeoxyribonuclease V subunit alpha [Thalassotalea sp.]
MSERIEKNLHHTMLMTSRGNNTVLLPYQHFSEMQQQLYGVMPIDYFLAKELVESLSLDKANAITCKDAMSLCFHAIVAVSMAIRSGDSCLPLNTIANARIGFYADENGIVDHHGYNFPAINVVNELLTKLLITADDNKPLVFAEQALYLRRYYNFEQELQTFINNNVAENPLMTPPLASVTEKTIKACLDELFPLVPHSDTSDTRLNESVAEIDWQKAAVANALNKRFSIIAGGPGTGKTYTVTKLLAAILTLNEQVAANPTSNQQPSLNISLVAPTGKAAQRLTESLIKAISGFEGEIAENILAKIPRQAQTLHRLLGVIPNNVNFRHHQGNLLAIDVLVVDEVSMVDLPMMARLIRALPPHCQLILLGDADQLPSVAVGNVLADLAPRPHQGYSKSNKHYLATVTASKGFKQYKNKAFDHVTFLTKSRRFDNKGLVGRLADNVIKGESQKSWQLLTNETPSALLPLTVNSWLPKLVKQYFQPLARATTLSEAFKLLAQFRILCATRVGLEGVENINQQVEQILYKSGNLQANNPFYYGKPIMITQNDYGLGLFNGDVGIIWADEKGMLIAVFEQPSGQYLQVLPSRLPSFETVYAMTIHKTQGSEFQRLVMILPQNKDSKILSRELLYTGITRAKQTVQIACAKSTWFQSVDTQVQRSSGINLANNN